VYPLAHSKSYEVRDVDNSMMKLKLRLPFNLLMPEHFKVSKEEEK